jgi:hypothetical protein
MMDWLPTLVELAGARLPDDRAIDGRSLAGVLQGHGEREATPFFYLCTRVPFGDQHHEVGAVRSGRWKLKLPQRGYPQLFEPILKTELYRHPLMLFDLEADHGEQHDVAVEHPDVVASLSKEIDAFNASLSPAPPVRIGAAARSRRLGEDLARSGRGRRADHRCDGASPLRDHPRRPVAAAAEGAPRSGVGGRPNAVSAVVGGGRPAADRRGS